MTRSPVPTEEETRHLHRLARLNTLVLDDDFVAPPEEWSEAPAPGAVNDSEIEEWFASLSDEGAPH